ncbi:secretion system protein [Parvibaculum sedimenti]|uniref:Secretion system protein n=1 Tax=Parvibaculum sedimenti TaxID=2608632 RepID=A0A6N6VDU0_9HYPH|nr:type II secretion system F family protein [Parvibaculum sedimenti]KAB7738888.1 secretion system protein [Parvibaculum sedimenti]
MTVSGGVLIAIGVVSAAVAWLFLSALLHLPIYIVVPGVVAAFYVGPRQVLKTQQRRVEDQFTDLFPEAVDMVTRMVRAGLPINVAFRAVGEEAPPPVNRIFSELAAEEKIGARFDEALASAADRVGLPDFRFFAVAVALHYSTGGNIAVTLEILSDIVRKRKATRLKAKATTAEVRTSAMVLGALPFVVIGGLLVLSPAYLAPLTTDPRGNVIIGLAIGFLAAAYFSMRWMMRRATRI